MKKVLFFYLRHIFSISFFVFCVMETFINGWPMLLVGAVISGVAFVVEYVIRMAFYKPSRRDMEEYRKKYCKGTDDKKDDDPIDLFFVG